MAPRIAPGDVRRAQEWERGRARRMQDAGEFPCGNCGQGCFTVRDNSDAPIPIRVPPSIHDDEGRHVVFCPYCDEELVAPDLDAPLSATSEGAPKGSLGPTQTDDKECTA